MPRTFLDTAGRRDEVSNDRVTYFRRGKERAVDTTLYLVMSNPVDDRDDEFNEWYDNVHIHDVLATPGMVSAQRYTVRETEINREAGVTPSHRYLVVYEMDGEPDAVMRTIRESVASGAMKMHDALDLTNVSMSFWKRHGSKVMA
jgi:hypothetical protein